MGFDVQENGFTLLLSGIPVHTVLKK